MARIPRETLDLAVRLYADGASAAAIYRGLRLELLGVSARTLRRWLAQFRARRGLPRLKLTRASLPTTKILLRFLWSLAPPVRAAVVDTIAAAFGYARPRGNAFARDSAAVALTDTGALPGMKGDSAHGANGE